MVRVRLPLLGVAAVLFAATTASAQAPGLVVYPSGLHVIVVTPEISWASAAEPADFLERLSGDGQLISYEADLPKDDGRIKPKPKQTTEPPTACSGQCSDECPVECEAFPTFCCLPFAPPPPPPPSGHKCHRRHKGCNHGGCGQANGNPYLGWPYCGMQGCASGFCPSYAQQAPCGHKCHWKHSCAASAPSYPGCGYPCMMGCPMPWGGIGCDVCNNDGCFGYCPPPYSCAASSGHKCHRKHRCSHGDSPCPRCGYPSYSSPSGSWAYPVGGWSTANDGWNGFTDPNCYPPEKHHCCGLFHRCHKQQAPPPRPYPCWQPMWQPCMSMDCACSE